MNPQLIPAYRSMAIGIAFKDAFGTFVPPGEVRRFEELLATKTLGDAGIRMREAVVEFLNLDAASDKPRIERFVASVRETLEHYAKRDDVRRADMHPAPREFSRDPVLPLIDARA